MNKIIFFLSLAVMGAFTQPAYALMLPETPSGTCPLDTKQDTDRNALGAMHLATQEPSTVSALFAECGELDLLRQDKIRNLTTYGVVLEQANPTAAPLDRASTIATLAQAIGLSVATSSAPMQPAAQGVSTIAAAESTHKILGQTASMLIVATEQRHLSNQEYFASAVVSVISVINGKLVTVNMVAPLQNPAIFTTLSTTASAYMAQLLAANP